MRNCKHVGCGNKGCEKTPKIKKPKLIYAKDCKCCKCGKQAVCFWPVCDPDIQEHPYCRDCVEKAKIRVLTEIYKDKN